MTMLGDEPGNANEAPASEPLKILVVDDEPAMVGALGALRALTYLRDRPWNPGALKRGHVLAVLDGHVEALGGRVGDLLDLAGHAVLGCGPQELELAGIAQLLVGLHGTFVGLVEDQDTQELGQQH